MPQAHTHAYTGYVHVLNRREGDSMEQSVTFPPTWYVADRGHTHAWKNKHTAARARVQAPQHRWLEKHRGASSTQVALNTRTA
jgi:hypothetical protein